VHPQVALEMGRYYLEVDETEKATLAYERALTIEPNLSRLRLTLGYLYLRQGHPERTIEVVQPMPDLPAEKHLLLSHAYREQRKLDQAAREVALAEEAALKAKDERFFGPSFYLFYATLCEDLGYVDRALEKVAKALELTPRDPVCTNFMGYVLADHNRDLDKAEAWVALALSEDPDNVAYIDSLAWVYFRQGRLQLALNEINRCLRLGGREEDAVILDHAGDIYWANGLRLLARRFWWEALALGMEKESEMARLREKLQQSESQN
jgi:tetratricopeptide (TPR) repeat protein